MIALLRGRVLAATLDQVVIDVAGVGYAVRIAPGTAIATGAEVTLHTFLAVREDSLTLYGFDDDDERDLFELLQSASGVGPRLAQAVLTVHPPDSVRRALQTEDLAALTLVPGIGRKGADRHVVELRDKVVGITPSGTTVLAGGGAARTQVVEALVGLGFAARQAEQAVEAVLGAGSDGSHADTGAVLRNALTRLGRNR